MSNAKTINFKQLIDFTFIKTKQLTNLLMHKTTGNTDKSVQYAF